MLGITLVIRRSEGFGKLKVICSRNVKNGNEKHHADMPDVWIKGLRIREVVLYFSFFIS